jgi:hypothetical protein
VTAEDPRRPPPWSWVWWEQDHASRLTMLLFISPGPSPRSSESWLTRFLSGRPRPGEWAVVDQPPLGPLPADLVAEMRTRTPIETANRARRLMTLDGEEILAEGGWEWDDPLASRVLEASNALAMGRVRQAGVGDDPAHSGLSLTRLRAGRSLVTLVTAPMRAPGPSGATPARAFAWSSGPRFGVQAGGAAPRWCGARADLAAAHPVRYGTVDIRLPGAPEPGSLPAASFAWDLSVGDGAPGCRVVGARVEVTRPPGQKAELLAELELPLADCHMPAGLCERWGGGATTDPVACITVTSPLSDVDPFGPAGGTAQVAR